MKVARAQIRRAVSLLLQEVALQQRVDLRLLPLLLLLFFLLLPCRI